MNQTTPGSTIGSLLTDLRDQTTLLLRQEVSLAKAELNEKARRAATGAIEIAGGGALAYAGLIVVLFGVGQLVNLGLVALGLGPGLASWLGFVLVGVVVGLIGWTMLAKAKKALSAQSLVPRETLASLQEDKQWAKTKIQQTTP